MNLNCDTYVFLSQSAPDLGFVLGYEIYKEIQENLVAYGLPFRLSKICKSVCMPCP